MLFRALLSSIYETHSHAVLLTSFGSDEPAEDDSASSMKTGMFYIAAVAAIGAVVFI